MPRWHGLGSSAGGAMAGCASCPFAACTAASRTFVFAAFWSQACTRERKYIGNDRRWGLREGDRSMFSANGLPGKYVLRPKNGPVPRQLGAFVTENCATLFKFAFLSWTLRRFVNSCCGACSVDEPRRKSICTFEGVLRR